MYWFSFIFGGSLYFLSQGGGLPTLWTFLTGCFGTFNLVSNLVKMKGDTSMKKKLWLSTGVSAQG